MPNFSCRSKIEVGRKEEREGGARVQACLVLVADGEAEKILWLFVKN